MLNYQSKIESYLQKNNGLISSSYCKSRGIPTVYLTRLHRRGKLLRLTKGLYGLPDSGYDELFIFQHRYKRTIFSYETALFLLGESDRLPQSIDVTVANSYKFNRPPANLLIHYVDPKIISLGVQSVQTMFGNSVKAYSYERVLCDFIANKDKVDAESYVKTIQGYAKYQNRDVHHLWEIAHALGIENRVRDILELIYE